MKGRHFAVFGTAARGVSYALVSQGVPVRWHRGIEYDVWNGGACVTNVVRDIVKQRCIGVFIAVPFSGLESRATPELLTRDRRRLNFIIAIVQCARRKGVPWGLMLPSASEVWSTPALAKWQSWADALWRHLPGSQLGSGPESTALLAAGNIMSCDLDVIQPASGGRRQISGRRTGPLVATSRLLSKQIAQALSAPVRARFL